MNQAHQLSVIYTKPRVMKTLGLLSASSFFHSCQLGPSELAIIYFVKSTECPLRVSFENETSGTTTEQAGCDFSGQSHWVKHVILRRGSVASLSAQIDGSSTRGSMVEAFILCGGKTVQRSESRGTAYGVAIAGVRLE